MIESDEFDAAELDLVPYPTYPKILDQAPSPADGLTHYDQIHGLLFARLLSAYEAGAGWREAARSMLFRDVDADSLGARRCWESHIARARWLATEGLRLAARGAQPAGDHPSDYPMMRVPEKHTVSRAAAIR